MDWIRTNASWLFSGIGVAVLGVGFALVRFGFRRWRESRASLPEAEQQQLMHARVAGRSLQSRLPRVVLRLFYKPDDIQERVVIALRDNAPGSANMGQPVPYVDLYFQITNLSPLDLVLDRALVDVWFGQPTFTAFLLHRYSVRAGEITKGIHVRHMVTESQKAYIQAFDSATPGNRGRFYIYVTAYFESKLGRFFVQSSIERDRL